MKPLKNYVTVILLLSLTTLMNSQPQALAKADNYLANLTAFARLYGYVRYFHPSDEAAQMDWDKFVVYGAYHASKAASPEILTEILLYLFRPIAPTLNIYKTDQTSDQQADLYMAEGTPSDPSAFRVVCWQHIGLGLDPNNTIYKSIRAGREPWERPMQLFNAKLNAPTVIVKDLGLGLSCSLPLSLYADEHITYPDVPADLLEKFKGDIQRRSPSRISVGNVHVRYAGVIITWNILQHFYPNFDKVNVDWNHVLQDTLKEVSDQLNESEFLHSLQRMLVPLQDGHADVYHPIVSQNAGFQFALDWIENRVVVTVSADSAILPGDQLLTVDRVDARKIMTTEEKLISGSPQWKRKKVFKNFNYGPKGSCAQLTFKRKGKTFSLTMSRTNTAQLKEFHRPAVKKLEHNIYYIDMESLDIDQFHAQAPQLAQADGYIFDVRGYAAFEKRDVLTYLIDEIIKSPTWNVPRILFPDQQAIEYTDQHWQLKPRQPRFKGKAVFLIDNNTISASETFASIARHYKIGTLIGSPSAGMNGNSQSFSLPGEYRVIFTGMRIKNHDGSRFFGDGVLPDIPLERTISGLEQGKDQLLEAAIKHLKSN